MRRFSMIFTTVITLACTNNLGGAEASDTGGECEAPADAIAWCEGSLSCSDTTCAAEHAAVDQWQSDKPAWDETCAQECAENRNPDCETTCMIARSALTSMWVDDGIPLTNALDACNDGCMANPDAYIGTHCIKASVETFDPQTCAELFGVLIANGEYEPTCACRMAEVFGTD